MIAPLTRVYICTAQLRLDFLLRQAGTSWKSRTMAATSSTGTAACSDTCWRDGVVAAGYERDVRMLGRLKREFDFFCVDLLEEHELVLAAGGEDGNSVLQSVAAYDRRIDSWTESTPMLEAREYFGMCVIAGEVYILWRVFNIGSHCGIGGAIQSAEQHVEFGCCDADCNSWPWCMFSQRIHVRAGWLRRTRISPASAEIRLGCSVCSRQ